VSSTLRRSNPFLRPGIALLGVSLALFVGLSFGSSSVRAEDIPRLQGFVTDTTGVLGTGRADIDVAIRDLKAKRVDLWVVFVRTTGSRTAEDYARTTAQTNSLGVNDVLLLVALDDRTDYILVSDGLPSITGSERDSMIATELEPRLAAGDFAGAVVATARALGQAANGSYQPGGQGAVAGATGAPSSGTPSSGTPATGNGFPWWLPPVVIGAGVLLLASRRRPTGQPGGQAAAPSVDLARQANALLVQADEAVRSGQQELGFGEAEFEPAELAGLRKALETAPAELRAAFAVRQKLDDAEPESPADRDRMLAEIIERCRRVIDGLDAEVQRLDEMRDISRSAPEVLAALPAQIQALDARLPAAERVLGGLAKYADSVVAPVKDNVVGARTRMEAARKVLEEGERAEASADQNTLRRAARLAHTALDEATTLLDAVDRLAASVKDAELKLEPALAEAESSIAAAKAAGDATAGNPDLVEAQSDLARARKLAAGAGSDPVEAYRLALESNRIADTVAAAVRAAEEQSSRARALAEHSIASATAALEQASDYIAARRWVLGRTARTRLAEADRLLTVAESELASDPAAAARDAQAAQQLATHAMAQAQAEAEGGQPYGGLGTDDQSLPGQLAPVLLPWILGGLGSGRGWPSPGNWPGSGGGLGGGFGGGGFGGGGGGGFGQGSGSGGRW
jgi:uncharacterized membrane protein YgcG